MLERITRHTIPIVAHTRQRAVPKPPVPVPEVGARWGRPSKFDWAGGDGGGHQVLVPPGKKDLEISGEEVYREWELVRVVSEDNPSVYSEFERTKKSYFYAGERTEDAEESTGKNRVRPVRTTIYIYYELAFPLHEGGEVINSGQRGEHPDVSLAKVQSEYDSTVAGMIQQSSEFWEGFVADGVG